MSFMCVLCIRYTPTDLYAIKLGKLAEGRADSEISFKLCSRFVEGYFQKGEVEIFTEYFDSVM